MAAINQFVIRSGVGPASSIPLLILRGLTSGTVTQTYIDAYGSAIPRRTPVTLALFNEDRSERLDVDINSQITAVTIKTNVNKGFDQATIGIAPDPKVQAKTGVIYGQLPEPLELRDFTRAELRVGGSTAFEGRLGPANIPSTQLVINGHWRELYSDDWYASTDTTLDSAGNVIKGMLAAGLSAIRPAAGSGWQDPNSEHAPSEFDGKSVGDALVQITSEGDSLGNDLDWYVWEDRRLHLISRAEPELPDYRVAFDPETMIIQRDPSDVLTRLTVEFKAVNSGTATISSGNTSVTVTHGLGVAPDIENIRIDPTNDLGEGASWYVDAITTTTFDLNLVQEESNSGSSTVASGSTSVDVTHGLSRTPTRREINVVWSNNPTNDRGTWWLSNLGVSTFRVNVRNDPGSGGATFDWGCRFQDTKAASDPGTGGASFAWAIDAGLQRTSEAVNATLEHNIGRPIRQKHSVGAMTLAAAERIRDRLLVKLSRPRYSARVRIEARKHLSGPHGEILAPSEARAGDWAAIANLPMLISTSTVFDVTGEQLDISFGDPLPTLREQLRRLELSEARRRRGIDPESGGALG